MAIEDQHEKIIQHLDLLNRQVALQNSLSRMFVIGIVYGIGFFVGSAIIATIALGVFGPWFAEIPWVHSTFQAGAALLR